MDQKTKVKEKLKVESLYKISQIAARSAGLDDLWDPLFEEILKIMCVDAGTLLILEDSRLIRKVAVGLDPEIMKEPPIEIGEGISGKVAETKKPIVHKDLSKAQIASKIVGRRDFHSLITVPMMTRNQLVGIMSIFTKKERKFSDQDLSLFSTIANQAAMAIVSIENTKLIEENLVQIRQLTALNEIAKTVSHFTNFSEIHYTISGIIAGLFGAEKCFFILEENGELKAKHPGFGIADDILEKIKIDVHNDSLLINKVFFGGQGTVEANYKQEREGIIPTDIGQIHSLMLAPLRFKNQSLGVVIVASSKANNFDQKNLSFLNTLGSQVASILSLARAYQVIEESKKQDEAILESIAEAVYAVNNEGKYILVNKTAQLLTGFDQSELLKKKASDFIKFVDKDLKPIGKTSCPALEALYGKKVLSEKNDVYIQTRSKQLIPVTYNAAPILNPENKIIGGIVAFSDISRELQVERMKQELISIASHELKAPVTAMQGYLEMLISGDIPKIEGEAKTTLHDLLTINKRLIDLVEDLLNVSRIEQGRMKFDIKKVNIIQIVQAVHKEYVNMAKQKSIELIVEINSKNELYIQADETRTHEIISNLMSNAIKYTPKGKVVLKLIEKPQKIVIEISDTGVGMNKEQQSHLFEKFYRAKNSEVEDVGGTGLGLYITKQIIKNMKGEIWIESELGKGSKFSFSLPRAK
ncbi:MAG: ATP-binding protein [bacterium]